MNTLINWKSSLRSFGMGLLFVAVLMLSASSAYAQPSDATIKAKAIQDGAVMVKFYGTGRVHTSLTEGTWYIRSMETHYQTEYPGIKQSVSLEYKYKKSGSSWVFDRTYTVESFYIGVPNPKESEIVAVISKNLAEYFGNHYNSIVGDIGEIKLAKEPRWIWHSLQSV